MTVKIIDPEGRPYSGWQPIAREIFSLAGSRPPFARVADLQSAEWLDKFLGRCRFVLVAVE